MVLVKKTKNKSVQKMIAEFKRKVRDAGIKEELEERRYYTKPSQLRREREKKIIRARKNL
jgi:ribosomal protein S21|tara:strand:+ start:7967 stop:8146 length:180 start_codon:yes stop_codon:yes gene_type:complete